LVNDLLPLFANEGGCHLMAARSHDSSVLSPSLEGLKPYNQFFLPVDAPHVLYVEEYGNPFGVPVVFLHGGPGAGCHEGHRALFDPKVFRVVLFDQRGAGKSTPFACLENNTTWDLVEDIEAIRQHLGIERWLVLGGSWGSTLALAYAQIYPAQVLGLVVRGIFLCRQEELLWFYQSGAHCLNPVDWEPYCTFIPTPERHDMMAAYYRRLTSDDPALQLAAAHQWSAWEGANLRLLPDPDLKAQMTSDAVALALARIECHYFMHNAFFTEETALLNPKRMARLAGIPVHIIHGKYDIVCPVKNAWDLKQALPHAHLTIVPDAGHASSEPGIYGAQQSALAQLAAELI
jgi:proline iminopeptidase